MLIAYDNSSKYVSEVVCCAQEFRGCETVLSCLLDPLSDFVNRPESEAQNLVFTPILLRFLADQDIDRVAV